MRRLILSIAFPYLFIFISMLILASGPGAIAQEWSTPVRISEPGGCWTPQILAQGDTLHVIYSNSKDGWKISYVGSTDGGETWTSYQVLSVTVNTSNTYFPRVIGHNGQLLAVWIAYFLHGVYRFNIGYSASNDNGINWSSPQYILDSNLEWPFYLTAAGADSLIIIIFSWGYADSMYFYACRSTDFGARWFAPRQIFSASEVGGLDIAVSDTLAFLSWAGRFNTIQHVEIYYTSSSDAGIDWSPNIPLSEPDQFHSQLPSIDVDRTGNVALAWMDYKRSPYFSTGDILARKSDDHGNDWMPEVQITQRHRSWSPDIVSQGDTLYVVWQDHRPENGRFSIYFSQSTDDGQTWSDEFRLDSDSCESREPVLATSYGGVYAVWAETRYSPDTSGLYFSRWPYEPDAIGEEDADALPREITLSAYPNPFNSSTIISYRGASVSSIAIYDIEGRLVRNLVTDAENGDIIWDARDEKGRGLSSGIYFARAVGKDDSRSAYLKLICTK